MESSLPRPPRTLWDMTSYQWTVLFAAWLGWGFDVFDGLLFNYVAPNCVPTLLGLQINSPAAKAAALHWTGIMTSVLLLGWAVGGITLGRVADRVGRTKTLLLTMLLYSLGTAACAFAPNLWVLMAFRFVAALGIGGEWAAGAAMVAEVVPEKRRIEAGALLYTSAPFGLFLATILTYQISGNWLKNSPETSWRAVLLCGLIPAVVAFLVRVFVKEPERWHQNASHAAPPRLAELFTPQFRRQTLSGFCMALTALVTWWSCNAFIPVVATNLAQSSPATLPFKESWRALATNCFNLGGLVGTLLTIPIAKHLGRKQMFTIYFLLSAAALFAAFGLPLDPHTRLYFYFPIGLTVFGIFGSFTFYLPELFPTRLRGTGAGFCYNVGRIFTAIGPFAVGAIAAHGLPAMLKALFCVGFAPLLGLCTLPWVIETRGRVLED